MAVAAWHAAALAYFSVSTHSLGAQALCWTPRLFCSYVYALLAVLFALSVRLLHDAARHATSFHTQHGQRSPPCSLGTAILQHWAQRQSADLRLTFGCVCCCTQSCHAVCNVACRMERYAVLASFTTGALTALNALIIVKERYKTVHVDASNHTCPSHHSVERTLQPETVDLYV